MINTISGLKGLLEEPKKIVITTHVRPDADALGSSLALYLTFKKLNHDVTVITPSGYPNFIKWMKGNEEVLVYSSETDHTCQALIKDADITICNDFSALCRINELGDYIGASKGIKVLIDHHLEPEDFADYALWNPSASSTCELIYNAIHDWGHASLIDEHIAACIYAGIMTDTGSFRFPSTSKEVHLILADLFDKGIDHSKIHRLVYDDNNESRLRLLGYALSEKLVVNHDYKTAYITLSQAELDRFQYEQGDTEGIVNYALSINGIVFAAIIMEKDNMVKMSFRSVGSFNVSQFAKTHFNGGGHKNAAGGRGDSSFTDEITKFTTLLPSYKDQLTSVS